MGDFPKFGHKYIIQSEDIANILNWHGCYGGIIQSLADLELGGWLEDSDFCHIKEI